jgi:4-hydroxyacetophenone monooxygenase
LQFSQSAIDSANIKILQIALALLGLDHNSYDLSTNSVSRENVRDALNQLYGKTIKDRNMNISPAVNLLSSNKGHHGVLQNECQKMSESPTIPATFFKDFSVAIVGLGISGLLVAQECLARGIRAYVYEANEETGGTWVSKIYPGARCDVQGNLYTYAKNQVLFDSPYLAHKVIKDYLESCLETFGLHNHVKFRRKVSKANWDPETKCWIIQILNVETGDLEVQSHNVLISATGQLSKKYIPKVPNMDAYEGKIIHANSWPKNLEVKNSKVSLIGSGATASQLLPYLAEQNNKISYVFRTPSYFIDVPYYRKNFDSAWMELFSQSSLYRDTYRLIKFTESIDGNLSNVKKHNSNELAETLIQKMKDRIGLDDFRLETCLPTYPLGAKRILLDDGTFFNAIKNGNVTLFKESYFEFYRKGITFPNGVQAESDWIIFATGFDSTKMFSEFEVRGLSSSLEEFWNEDPSAYLGIVVPEFPNFFLMFGPNTNVVVNGSNTFMAECQASYIAKACLFLVETSSKSLVVKKEAVGEWENYVNKENLKFNWNQNEVNSWYVNRNGRVIANFPGSSSDYWARTIQFEEKCFAYE